MTILSQTKLIISLSCVFFCGTPAARSQKNHPPADLSRSLKISIEQEKIILENVEMLSSPEYRKRVTATSNLIEIGIPAIPHIGRKANDNDPESRQRCFQILRKLATGKTPEISRIALSELESLTSATNRLTAIDAKHTMSQIRHGYRSMMQGMGALIETHDKQNDIYSASLNLSYCKEKTIAFHLLQHLWKIESINLNYSKLDSQSLVWLGYLTDLESLEMKKVEIPDGSFRFLEKLKRLKKLDLALTSFTDQNLKSLRQLTNLEYCNLSETKISNKGLNIFEHLTELKEMNLGGTNIDDEGMAFLKLCPNLEILRLKETKISNKTMSLIGGLKKLRVLSLSGTKIDDKGLSQLKNLKNLKMLWVSRTDVTARGERQLVKSLPEIDIHQ